MRTAAGVSILILMLAVMPAQAAHCPVATSPSDDVATFRSLESEWIAAEKALDAAWFEKHFAERMSTNGRFVSPAEYFQSIAAMKNSVDVAEIEPEMNVRIFGDVAIVNGIEHIAGRNAEGKAFDRRISFTDVFVRCGDRWLVVANHYSLAR